MFVLDSLMISGLRWVLGTVVAAAEAELNDDAALRARLLETEMRREAGEITDDEFRRVERDLLARIREIREQREGASAPIAVAAGERLTVEAETYGNIERPLEPRPRTARSNTRRRRR